MEKFTETDKCLHVEDLTVMLKGFRILNGVSFKHCGGRVLVVIGRNGSGKTTLAKAIAGLIKPDKGRVLFDGVDYTSYPPWVRRFAFAPTPFPLIENKSVKDTLEAIAKLNGRKSDLKSEIAEIAKRYEITHLLERQPHQLSTGERQRVGIAAVVLAKPRIAIFDEPLAHLSKKWALTISMEIEKLAREENIPVIVTTPRLEDALMFGENAMTAVLNRGVIVAMAPLKRLYSTPPSLDVLNGLDYHVSNIVDLRDSSKLARITSGFCNERARYAWLHPSYLEVCGDSELKGVIEKTVFEGGSLTLYVRVDGLAIAVRVSDHSNATKLEPGGEVALRVRGVMCYDGEGKLLG